MGNIAKVERGELRVAPLWAQGWNEEGSYDFQKGWVIEARVPRQKGDAFYTYQAKTFRMDEERLAEREIERLCGRVSNAYWCNIEIGPDDGRDIGDWMITGASY